MPGRADRASQSNPDAATHRAPAERVARQTASDATTTNTSTHRQRLPYGQLTPLVVAHLRAYPDSAFTPWELARVLGHSHGTIRRILMRLTAAGAVDQVSERPARFRHHP
jgi:DNA-binding GntR family transcriptional regulator